FSASDLVLATTAFMEANCQVTPTKETEDLLDKDEVYLEDAGDIDDVLQTFKRLTTDINQKILDVYQDDPNKKYILSAGGTFLLGLSASCGKIKQNQNLKVLEGCLDRLVQLFENDEDPLNLEDYYEILSKITTSRGKTIRRLVYETFLRFFNGA